MDTWKNLNYIPSIQIHTSFLKRFVWFLHPYLQTNCQIERISWTITYPNAFRSTHNRRVVWRSSNLIQVIYIFIIIKLNIMRAPSTIKWLIWMFIFIPKCVNRIYSIYEYSFQNLVISTKSKLWQRSCHHRFTNLWWIYNGKNYNRRLIWCFLLSKIISQF